MARVAPSPQPRSSCVSSPEKEPVSGGLELCTALCTVLGVLFNPAMDHEKKVSVLLGVGSIDLFKKKLMEVFSSLLLQGLLSRNRKNLPVCDSPCSYFSQQYIPNVSLSSFLPIFKCTHLKHFAPWVWFRKKTSVLNAGQNDFW